MEGRVVGLDPLMSPFEIAATGPDEREYNPVARPVNCSADVLLALRGVAHAKDARARRGAGVGTRRKSEVVGLLPETKARMVEAHRRGDSLLKIARDFGGNVNRVREIANAAANEAAKEGETMAGNGGRIARQLSEQDELVLVAFYEAGHTVTDTAIEFQIGAGRVQKILEKRGVTLRPRTYGNRYQRANGVSVAPSVNGAVASERIEAALQDASANLEHPSALSVFNVPGVMVSNADPFAQLSRLADLVRELKGIDGAQVAGSVSITLSVDLPLGGDR